MKFLLTIIAALVSFSTFANVLEVRSGVEVLAVNGLKVKVSDSYEINKGFNQIVVRMSKRLTNGSTREQFISKPYIISFNADRDVLVEHPKVLNFTDAEKKFRHATNWSILQGGSPLVYDSRFLPGKEGFMPYLQLEDIINEYNEVNGIVLTADLDTPAGQLKKAEKARSEEVVKQLKLWYSKANTSQRTEFRRWMIDQE
ncbi:DUF2057 family protein [Vibrio sp. Hep-1b-8]|uniref:YccT family protein n=1 Tax=Vibrio sp. Hep-1b-8 TaxID=2144187 RepID=UPI0011105682|nr:DUF2057 family protein [Vibrio sp. Hep-1b-8]TMX47362.1 hypothetical protein DA100_00150 [Vibrio sp. Hep-1b-8]